MNQITETSAPSLLNGHADFDPIEERLRANVRATIEQANAEVVTIADRLAQEYPESNSGWSAGARCRE